MTGSDSGSSKAPAAELEITPALVRSLLAEQHPDLARRPLSYFSSGWDNENYRLGHDLLVRLPRRRLGAALIEHEQRWLPQLEGRLPIRIPTPSRVGRPGPGFPWSWSVVPFLPGRDALHEPPVSRARIIGQLCDFLTALHQPAPPEAPFNGVRGIPLADRHERTCAALDQAAATVPDTLRLQALWARAVAAPAHAGPPRWLHGDLHPGNILCLDDRITAVLDWGDLTAGDPSCDYWVAWAFLDGRERLAFRRRLAIDEAAWLRSIGWAISIGLALVTMTDDQPAYNGLGRRAIRAVLAGE